MKLGNSLNYYHLCKHWGSDNTGGSLRTDLMGPRSDISHHLLGACFQDKFKASRGDHRASQLKFVLSHKQIEVHEGISGRGILSHS